MLETLLHIFWPPFTISTPNLAPLPFTDMEYYFYQHAYRDLKVPKCFVGKCSALPLLTGTRTNKLTPLHVGTSYTHDFRVYSKENARGLHTLRTTINRETPPLKFLLYLLFRPKGGRKTINVFSCFNGLVPDTNYKHLENFVMLGTHFEPRRGKMSHICDIS